MLSDFVLALIISVPIAIACIGFLALIVSLGTQKVELKPLSEWKDLT
jgi:hypothetical protein